MLEECIRIEKIKVVVLDAEMIVVLLIDTVALIDRFYLVAQIDRFILIIGMELM